MGLEEEIARQQDSARQAQIAADDRFAEALTRCQEFRALVHERRVRPAAYYYREVGQRRSGNEDLTVYKREGVYWMIKNEEYGRHYRINDRGEPVTLGVANTHSGMYQRRLAAVFEGPGEEGDSYHKFTYIETRESQENKRGSYPWIYTEEALAAAFLEQQKRNGTW
jgi:hypothetical protein